MSDVDKAIAAARRACLQRLAELRPDVTLRQFAEAMLSTNTVAADIGLLTVRELAEIVLAAAPRRATRNACSQSHQPWLPRSHPLRLPRSRWPTSRS